MRRIFSRKDARLAKKGGTSVQKEKTKSEASLAKPAKGAKKNLGPEERMAGRIKL